MTGREERRRNDLFFLCSLTEYVGRRTKNRCPAVVNAMGRRVPERYQVHHSDKIDKVPDRDGIGTVEAMEAAYNSWIVGRIDDYGSLITSYQYASYKAGRVL